MITFLFFFIPTILVGSIAISEFFRNDNWYIYLFWGTISILLLAIPLLHTIQ